ncbi:hypothetical protein [Pendulispora albinea]|uniref:Portal protein n=1 Tax=Pendulispora albinea TaxID=2741071 RepID=A0ABZ2LXE4_9BACT
MAKRRIRVDEVLHESQRGGATMNWWTAPEGEQGPMVATVVSHIQQRYGWRRESDLLHAEMYGGGSSAAGMASSASRRYVPSALPRNVCRQAVDTIRAKTAKHRPLPQCLTSRGSWKEQKRARKMTQFLEGVFYQAKVFETHSKNWVRDAAVFGRGVLKAFRTGSKIRVERVHPWELLCDDWDARYGEPRSLYHVRSIDAGVAAEMFADDEEKVAAIYTSAGASRADEWDWQGDVDTTVSRVRIAEAWHLCANEEAHSGTESVEHRCTGRHVITLLDASKELLSEPWGETEFPFAILNFDDPITGFWGVGLCEMLEGWQYAINKQFSKIQDSHDMLGGGMILKPLGADIVDTSFTNGVVPIVTYKANSPPMFVTPAPVHPQVYQRDREMPQDALGEVGLTPTSTQGMKQPGITSGIAIQTLDDIEDERHVIFGRAYEAACLQLARIFLRLAAQIAADPDYGEMTISVPMRDGLLKLSWKDVSLNDFMLRVFPTSLLPQQLGARLQKLRELFDAQIIDRQTFLQQLDAPDLGAELDLETADRLNIDEKLELILDAEGQREVDVAKSKALPSAYQDFRWAQRRAQQRLNQAETHGVDEYNLDALREFIAECEALIENDNAKQVPTGPPEMSAPMPPPPGVGGPPMPPGPPMGEPPMPMGNAA